MENFNILQSQKVEKTKFLNFLDAIRTLTQLKELNLCSTQLLPQMERSKRKTKYNSWVNVIVRLSVESLVNCFTGDILNLSNCGLGSVFLDCYVNTIKNTPKTVKLKSNSFSSEEAACFIYNCNSLPSKILFDNTKEIQETLGSMLLEDKGVDIKNE